MRPIPRGSMSANGQALLLALAIAGSATPGHLAQAAGVPTSTTAGALRHMTARGMVERPARGVYQLGPAAPAWARVLAEREAERRRWAAQAAELLAAVEALVRLERRSA